MTTDTTTYQSAAANFHAALAHGWANFYGERLEPLLKLWHELANHGAPVTLPDPVAYTLHEYAAAHPGRVVPDPPKGPPSVDGRDGRYNLYEWARRVLDAAQEEEGGNAPNASATLDEEGFLLLRWDGTFTAGRWVSMEFADLADGKLQCRLEWCSGTGNPSRYLKIESLLSDLSCVDFGAFGDDA